MTALYDVEADKTCKKGYDLGTRNCRTADNLVECKRLIVQCIKKLSDRIGIGHHSAMSILSITPDGQMNW